MQTKQTIIPYFMVENAPEFMEFTKKALLAEVVKIEKLEGTEGIIHAEVRIGNSIIYVADTSADGNCGPGICGEVKSGRLVPIHMYIHVNNVFETYNKVIAEGATPLLEPSEETGNMGGFVDPFGNLWWIQ